MINYNLIAGYNKIGLFFTAVVIIIGAFATFINIELEKRGFKPIFLLVKTHYIASIIVGLFILLQLPILALNYIVFDRAFDKFTYQIVQNVTLRESDGSYLDVTEPDSRTGNSIVIKDISYTLKGLDDEGAKDAFSKRESAFEKLIIKNDKLLDQKEVMNMGVFKISYTIRDACEVGMNYDKNKGVLTYNFDRRFGRFPFLN